MWIFPRAGDEGVAASCGLAVLKTVLMASALMVAPWAAHAQVAPTIAIAFAPASIQSGSTSQLSITFGNPNDAGAVLNVPLVDTLPAGVTLVNGVVGGTCPAGAVKAGGQTITYAAQTQIPSGGCSIAVTVKGTSAVGVTSYNDTIPAGALQTTNGNNAAAATATLTVHAVATVPKLGGLTLAGATSAVQAAGLVLGAVQYGGAPAGTPFGTVFAQVPAPGATVVAGTVVTVHVSLGKASNPNSPITSTPGLVTPVQQSVAGAVERLCAELSSPAAALALSAVQQNLLANCKAILNTYGGGNDPAGLVGTLNAISGRQATAIQQTGLLFAGTQFTTIGARLAQLRQGASGVSFSGLDSGSPLQGMLAELLPRGLTGAGSAGVSTTGNGGGGPNDSAGSSGGSGGSGGADSSPNDQQSRWGFFINGNLRRGTQDTTAEEQGFNFQSNGLTLGADYRASDHWVFGAALAHSNGVTAFNDGSGRLDSRLNSASLYGTWYNEAWYLDVIGSYALISYGTSRASTWSINPAVISPLPSNCTGSICAVGTEGNTDARQISLGTSGGYSLHFGALDLGPDAALDYVHLAVNGFTENDATASGMGLVFDNQAGESLTLKAGGHLSYAVSTPIVVVLPQLSARYIHEFKNDQRALNVHFEDDPSAHALSGAVSTFQVYTDEPARSYFDYSAGITAQFPFGISAFASYSALGGYSTIALREYAFGIRFQHLVN